MADGREQRGALVDMPLNAVAHLQESRRRAPDLARAVRLERLDLAAAPERLSGVGQALDGAHLIADEQDRDGGQRHRRQGHPEHEDVALGRERTLSRRQDAHDPARRRHPNVHEGGIARCVEPEGNIQALGKRLLQSLVDRRHERAQQHRRVAPAGRDLASGLQGDRKTHRVLGPLGKLREGRRAGIVLIAFHSPGDVAGKTFREAGGHRLPVGVKEDIGHRDLHDRNRKDDDQQRPAEQGLGHLPLDPAANDTWRSGHF